MNIDIYSRDLKVFGYLVLTHCASCSDFPFSPSFGWALSKFKYSTTKYSCTLIGWQHSRSENMSSIKSTVLTASEQYFLYVPEKISNAIVCKGSVLKSAINFVILNSTSHETVWKGALILDRGAPFTALKKSTYFKRNAQEIESMVSENTTENTTENAQWWHVADFETTV